MNSIITFTLLFIATIGSAVDGMFTAQSSAGSIVITDQGDISCGGLVCPQGTVRCRLMKKHVPDTKELEFFRFCLDKDGVTLASDRSRDLSPYPGFKTTAEADIYGNYNVDGADMSPQAQYEFQKRIQNTVTNQMQQTMQTMNNQMQNMFQGMNHMFTNMFGRQQYYP